MARSTDAQIEAALTDNTGPHRDRARDGRDRVADVLRFIDIGPGDLSAVSRIFHSLVRVTGRRPRTRIRRDSRRADKDRAHRGGTVGGRTVRAVAAQCRAADRDCRKSGRPTEQIYAFCIARNYHDLHTPKMVPVDVHAFNDAVFRVLMPGGHYVIVDHRAQPGSNTRVSTTCCIVTAIRGRPASSRVESDTTPMGLS